jgi:hypothetical protein
MRKVKNKINQTSVVVHITLLKVIENWFTKFLSVVFAGLVGDFTGIQTLKKKLVAGQKKRCSGKEQGGRRVFVEGKQNDAILWGLFIYLF